MAYDTFMKEDVSYVIHGGDIFEGINNYLSLSYNSMLEEICDKQIKEFKKYYPNELTTYAVLGNHDFYWKEKCNILHLPTCSGEVKCRGINGLPGFLILEQEGDKVLIEHYYVENDTNKLILKKENSELHIERK